MKVNEEIKPTNESRQIERQERCDCVPIDATLCDLHAAAPALYEALQYVSEVSERQAAKDADDSDTVSITVTVGWLREVKDALALVDSQ